MPYLAAILHVFFAKIVPFFFLGPQTIVFTDVQHYPAIPSPVLPAPPVSSSCLDSNEEIDLRATRSPSC